MSTKKNGLKSGQKESSDFARNITWFSSSQKNVFSLFRLVILQKYSNKKIIFFILLVNFVLK